jgi:hypothetical protein
VVAEARHEVGDRVEALADARDHAAAGAECGVERAVGFVADERERAWIEGVGARHAAGHDRAVGADDHVERLGAPDADRGGHHAALAEVGVEPAVARVTQEAERGVAGRAAGSAVAGIAGHHDSSVRLHGNRTRHEGVRTRQRGDPAVSRERRVEISRRGGGGRSADS